MDSTVCGWCHHAAHLKWVQGSYRRNTFKDYASYNAAFECSRCGNFSVATWFDYDFRPDPAGGVQGRVVGEQKVVPPGDAFWYPREEDRREFPDLPPHIADMAVEAYLCRSVGALRGATILARAAIEAAAKHHGCETAGVAAKLTFLKDEGYIRRSTYNAADALRLAGNDIAHADPGDKMNAEECDELLAIMDRVLDEALEGDARLERATAYREERTGKQE